MLPSEHKPRHIAAEVVEALNWKHRSPFHWEKAQSPTASQSAGWHDSTKMPATIWNQIYHACISEDLRGLVYLMVCRQMRLETELAQMDLIVLNSDHFGLVLLLETKEIAWDHHPVSLNNQWKETDGMTHSVGAPIAHIYLKRQQFTLWLRFSSLQWLSRQPKGMVWLDSYCLGSCR